MRTWLVTVVALAVCSVPYGHTVTAITDVETQPVMMLRTNSNVAQVITGVGGGRTQHRRFSQADGQIAQKK